MIPETGSFWQRNKERLLTGGLFLFLAYSIVRNVAKAAHRPFWFDELCTWILAHQTDMASLWKALIHAADSHPPPFYLVEKFFSHIISNDEIAFRMPSILGFCCVVWCLFVWLRRRHDSTVAFFACLIPFVTALYATYATEARGYSVVAGCLSIALVAYQHAPAARWMFLLGLSLAGAESSHFYSIFMMAPFFLAEAIFFLKTKSLRLPVWIALACGFVPFIAFWPILAGIKGYYSEHAWMHPTILGTLRAYSWVFGIYPNTSGASFLSQAVWLLLTAGALVLAFLFIYRSLAGDPEKDSSFHESVLIAGFLLLPLVLYVVIKVTHGVLSARYLLPVMFGAVLAAGRGLSHLSKKSMVLIGVLLCVSIASQEAAFWISFYGDYQLGFTRPRPVQDLVAKVRHSDLAVVVSDGHDYLESDHYATPAWKQRLTFLADPSGAMAFGRTDFNDKELLSLRNFATLRVFEYARFKDSHSQFLLYSNPTPENNPDWFVLRLLSDGWSLQKLATDGNSSVYLVRSSKEIH